ncbi:hypothetical protein Bbelb_049580 [Branchiostoma belcheri]|nr:hypothetical protein Bbelb_049580 [Branchiostoma belcheri]
MKAKAPATVGSWQRAVTSGDGVYHTRGHHSKNMTVLAVDYLENALLAAVHLCMRGNIYLVPLFKGTAKAAEGYEFELKNDGISVDVHWQDGDSTSQKAAAYAEAGYTNEAHLTTVEPPCTKEKESHSSTTSAQENEYEVLRDDVITNIAAPIIEQRGNAKRRKVSVKVTKSPQASPTNHHDPAPAYEQLQITIDFLEEAGTNESSACGV